MQLILGGHLLCKRNNKGQALFLVELQGQHGSMRSVSHLLLYIDFSVLSVLPFYSIVFQFV